MAVVALVFLGGGGTVFWAYFTQREGGFATTDVHQFSTSGSALATVPTDLGSSGTGWLYAPNLLGEVRIRVTPANPDAVVFVGIGPSADVDRYLAGVNRTVISDFWTETLVKKAAARLHPSQLAGLLGGFVLRRRGTEPEVESGRRVVDCCCDERRWATRNRRAGRPRIRHPEVSGESAVFRAAVLLSSPPPAGLIGTTLRIARRQPLAFAKVNLTLGLIPVIATPQLAREKFGVLFQEDVPDDDLLTYWNQMQDES